MKTLLALRHLAFEDLGMLEPMFVRRGWQVRYRDVGVACADDLDPAGVDLLVILGGPIGAEEDLAYPYLAEEAAWIRDRLLAGRPTLGICLGAQLMARALGAKVGPMSAKEIGFAPLALTRAGASSPLACLVDRHVLHWHGDQFDLPAGVESLASTPQCPHQAFMVERHGLALQFHAEVDPGRIEQWLIGHAVELRAARVDLARLRADAARYGPGLARATAALVDRWLHGLDDR